MLLIPINAYDAASTAMYLYRQFVAADGSYPYSFIHCNSRCPLVTAEETVEASGPEVMTDRLHKEGGQQRNPIVGGGRRVLIRCAGQICASRV